MAQNTIFQSISKEYEEPILELKNYSIKKNKDNFLKYIKYLIKEEGYTCKNIQEILIELINKDLTQIEESDLLKIKGLLNEIEEKMNRYQDSKRIGLSWAKLLLRFDNLTILIDYIFDNINKIELISELNRRNNDLVSMINLFYKDYAKLRVNPKFSFIH